MPYINVSVGKALTDNQRNELGEALGRAVTVIPNKMYEKTMVDIHDCCTIYRGGKQTPCAFIETRLMDEGLDKSIMQEYTKKVYQVFEEVIEIPNDQLYANIIELKYWGSSGALK